jgi:hypothetical protein
MEARVRELQADLQGMLEPERRLEKSQRLAEAMDKLEQFKAGVMRLAETFLRIEVRSERLMKAKEYFEAGLFREADALLGEGELKEDQSKLMAAREMKERELGLLKGS